MWELINLLMTFHTTYFMNKPKNDVEYETPIDSFSKSNTLIYSKYKASLMEQKLLNVLLAKFQKQKDSVKDDLVCEIRAAELKKLLNSKSGNFYAQLKPLAASMTSKSIGFLNDETQTFTYHSLIVTAEYSDGVFKARFNSALKKYLTPQTFFTVLELQTILNYRSLYALRLHELLLSRCYQSKKTGIRKMTAKETSGKHYKIEISLAELKLCLGIVNAGTKIIQKALSGSKTPDYDSAIANAKEKRFARWSDFKNKVLDIGIKEINEMDNGIHVEYESLKSGKGAKVYAIIFYVDFTKGNDNKIDINNLVEEDIIDVEDEELTEERQFEIKFQTKSLIKEQLSFKDITAICEAANYDFGKIKESYDIACATSSINNLVGFMIKAIEGNYSHPVTKKKTDNHKKNHFNDFEQRNYDYSKLERGLLGVENISDVDDFSL